MGGWKGGRRGSKPSQSRVHERRGWAAVEMRRAAARRQVLDSLPVLGGSSIAMLMQQPETAPCDCPHPAEIARRRRVCVVGRLPVVGTAIRHLVRLLADQRGCRGWRTSSLLDQRSTRRPCSFVKAPLPIAMTRAKSIVTRFRPLATFQLRAACSRPRSIKKVDSRGTRHPGQLHPRCRHHPLKDF